MKVAIIGAGVSGLSCAIELERHGIRPDIFEQRDRAGELFTHASALLQIMNRPVKDPIEDLHHNFKIIIEPLNKLKKVTMHSPGVTGTVTGKLGYLVLRGQDQKSIANQLLAQVKSPVRFNTRAEYARMAGEYDFVIVATGNNEIAKVLGCWQDVYAPWVMGATVLGSFDPSAMEMWLNTDYAGSGYAYLTPFNLKSASLVLIVPGATRETIGDCWKKLWNTEKLPYQVVSTWDTQHFSGIVYPHRVDNILLAGNAGGFVEPLLGFALVAAVKSGVYAARSVVEGKSYEEYLEQLKENNRLALPLRKSLDKFGNKDFDRLITLLTTPGIKQLTYNTNIDSLKIVASMVNMGKKITSVFPRKIETGDRPSDP